MARELAALERGGMMLTFTPTEVAHYYALRAPQLKQRGRHWRGKCPLHNGEGLNFAVNAETGRWQCFSACGERGSMIDLEMKLSGLPFPAARAEVFSIVGRNQPSPTQTPPLERRRMERAKAWRRSTIRTLHQQLDEAKRELASSDVAPEAGEWVGTLSRLLVWVEGLKGEQLLKALAEAESLNPDAVEEEVRAQEKRTQEDRDFAMLLARLIELGDILAERRAA